MKASKVESVEWFVRIRDDDLVVVTVFLEMTIYVIEMSEMLDVKERVACKVSVGNLLGKDGGNLGFFLLTKLDFG